MKKKFDANKACSDLERDMDDLNDEQYVEACEEIASYFDSCANAKREEMEKEG